MSDNVYLKTLPDHLWYCEKHDEVFRGPFDSDFEYTPVECPVCGRERVINELCS